MQLATVFVSHIQLKQTVTAKNRSGISGKIRSYLIIKSKPLYSEIFASRSANQNTFRPLMETSA